MATVSANIRLDPVVKQQAQELFEELGMNLSTAVTIFLKQAVRERSIPFHVGDPFYSKTNQEYLTKVVSAIDSGKKQLKPHDILED